MAIIVSGSSPNIDVLSGYGEKVKPHAHPAAILGEHDAVWQRRPAAPAAPTYITPIFLIAVVGKPKIVKNGIHRELLLFRVNHETGLGLDSDASR